MKKRIILVVLMISVLVCLFAISASAVSTTGNIDYNEQVTLSDGTVLSIYDANKNPLIWFITGTDANGKNIYASIPATQTTADENGNVVQYSGLIVSSKDAYGTEHKYFNCTGLTIKYKLGENEDGTDNILTVNNVNNNNHNNLVVVANLRHVDMNIGDIQGGAFRSNVEYMFLPETMIKTGDWRQTHCKMVDLTQCVNLRGMTSQGFKIGSYIEEVRMPTIIPVYDEDGVLTNPIEMGTFAFQSCEKITSLDLPETLYSVGKNAFQNCKKLTTIGYVPNLTIVSADAFENCYVLTGLDFKSTKLTSIGARAFRYAGLQSEIEFPSTLETIGDEAFYKLKLTKSFILTSSITSIGSKAFRENTTMEYFDFNGYAPEHLADHFLWKNSNLRAVSLPAGLKTFGTRPFEGCTNLEVMYLPDSVTAFPYAQGLSKLYFVNEPFTIDWSEGIFDSADWNGQKPDKPEIYYMPTSLTSFMETGLHSCTGINDTVVFSNGITEISEQYTFFAIPNRNFVFLGNVTSLNVNSTQTSNYYFINDSVTAENLALSGNGKHNLYFHSAGVHLCEAKEYTDATCLENKKEISICFCGDNMGTLDIEGTALGHEFDLADGAKALSARYKNYVENGFLTTECARCKEETNEQQTLNPIISRIKGYATSEDGKEITFGYDIDTDALEYYNELADSALELGFVVAVNAYLDGAPLNSDGTEATLAKGKVVKTVTNAVYSSVDFRLTGKWNDNITIGDEETQLKYVELFIAGYIFDGAVNYVNNEGSSADYTTVVAVTHTNKPVEA